MKKHRSTDLCARDGRARTPLALLLLSLLALQHLDLLRADPAPDALHNLLLAALVVVVVILRRPDRAFTRERRRDLQVCAPFRLLGLPPLARVALLLLAEELLDDRPDAVNLVAQRRKRVLQVLHLRLERVRRRVGRSSLRSRAARRDAQGVERLLLSRERRVEVGVLRSERRDDAFKVCPPQLSATTFIPSCSLAREQTN